jgi:sorting nexin-29
LKVNNGLRQGDPLACLLFDVALEKAVREANIQTMGQLFNKYIQILAYGDNVEIARSKADLTQTFLSLEIAANKMGLSVN